MYLKRLRLHGFKSFADETTIEFAPGVTCIVGPNGCGKSNIVDSVRWVIGEQRARILRSDKMISVLFNGTARRRALGMAEVQLTIENTRGILPTEYAEVQIGRRLFRSGESTYLLNGTEGRLKDIQDLFMDTGMGAGAYSVIELKMVEEILSDNTDERRHLFEEAAGVTKYKLRRQQALRKLDGTQHDLERVRDLTDEIEKNVARLKRQAAKAERYRRYAGRLETLDLMLAQAEYDALREQREGLSEQAERQRKDLEAYDTQLAKAEAEGEAQRVALVEAEERRSQQQQKKAEHLEAVRAAEAERRLHAEREGTAGREAERAARDREAAEAQQQTLTERTQRLKDLLAAAEPEAEEAEAARVAAAETRDAAQTQAAEAQEKLRAARRAYQDAQNEAAAARREADGVQGRVDLLAEEQQRLDADRAALERRDEEQAAALEEAQKTRDEAAAERDAARQALEAAEAEQQRLQAERDAARDRLARTERQHDAARAERDLLQSLVASYEEFPDTVQYLAAHREAWSDRPLRTVSDVLGCDEEHRLALDAALGDLAACVVVENAEHARAAMDRLRAEDQGQATFLLLDRLPDAPPPAEAPGDATPLADLVRVAEDRFRPLAALLLRGAFVVDDLEQARELAEASEPGQRFFVPTGEYAASGGLLHGGSPRRAASPALGRFARREQLADAETTLKRLEGERAEQQQALEKVQQDLAAVALDPVRRRQREAQQAVSRAEQQLARVQAEAEGLAGRRDDLGRRLASLNEERGELQERLTTLRAQADEAAAQAAAERDALDAAENVLEQAQAAQRDALGRYNDANVAAVQAQARRDAHARDLAAAQEQRQALAERMETAAQRRNQLREEAAEAAQTVAQLDEQLEGLAAARPAVDKAVNQAATAHLEAQAALSNTEHRLRQLRRERERLQQGVSEGAVGLAQVETRLEGLLDGIYERYERDLSEDAVPVEIGFDRETARTEAKELRRKVKGLGTVNELAVEEYDEERERLAFFQEQQQDLAEAEHTLVETISEINETASQRFLETFGAIRSNFQRLFRDLFGENASADLQLAEDHDDPLDAPVEIWAQPRGKRPAALSQLSSGEKTLTALALLFAIYLEKPSPFCILDEVDAPLDDANVERFMRLLDRFTDRTQFVIVTHNKLTMEAADRLYGVTMQEQGVSKLVGVRFDEAAELAS